MSRTDDHPANAAAAALGPAERALIDGAEFATLATIGDDGSPQLSVVWVMLDGADILVSSLEGRRKTINLRKRPAASLSIYYRADPYHYLTVRGRVRVDPDPEGALIQALSQRYTGGPYLDDSPSDRRVVLRLCPSRVYSTLPAGSGEHA